MIMIDGEKFTWIIFFWRERIWREKKDGQRAWLIGDDGSDDDDKFGIKSTGV